MSSTFEGLGSRTVGGLVLAALAVLAIGKIAPHFDRDTYVATVTDKERVIQQSGEDGIKSRYLIFTELEDGTTKVFQNSDSWLELKFRSSDVYGQLKEGETFEFETYGWRVPLFSWYENIKSVTSVPSFEEAE